MTTYSEDEATIRTRMLNNISDSVDKSEGYLVYDNIAAASKEFAKISNGLDSVKNELNINNLADDELTARVKDRTGIDRNLATYATGVLTLTGNGSIKIGDLFQTPSGIQFASTEAKTITTSGTINVKAVVAGSTGNIPTGQITVMPITISAITSVTNASPTENGFDAETDAELLTRYYAKLQEPSTQGNIAQFKSLVKSYTGVGDCKVFPTWNGNNTIKLVIIDANKQVPTSDFVNEIQNRIDPLGDNWGLGYGDAPFGCFTSISGASGKTINVSFTVTKDINYTDAQRLANIQASINAYFKLIAFLDNAIVSYAQIGSCVLNSAGVLDYANLTINGGTANIPISLTSSLCEIPVLGAVNIS